MNAITQDVMAGAARAPAADGFGRGLKTWRERRGMSQLALAGVANSSQRHLSFLESGRARPSREMALRLAVALDVPLREQNALLLAAGFAPAWREGGLAAPDARSIDDAVARMLRQQEPFPAVVVDRNWNLLRANDAIFRLLKFLTGRAPTGAPPGNLLEGLLSPEGLRPFLVNWRETALHLLRGLRSDPVLDGSAETRALVQRLEGAPEIAALLRAPPPPDPAGPVLPLHFRKGTTDIRLFTVMATLGSPRDVALQETMVEFFFPMDAATAALFRKWAKRK